MAERESELVEDLVDEIDEQQQVLGWRIDQLRRLGFDLATAVTLANDAIDLNEARSLIAQGCPVDTASRILL